MHTFKSNASIKYFFSNSLYGKGSFIKPGDPPIFVSMGKEVSSS